MTSFNHFAQELFVHHAIVSADDSKSDTLETTLEHANVAQSVNCKTTIVDKVADVTDAFNINAAFTIKHDKLNAEGKEGLVNTNKLKSSDMNFVMSVRVVSQIVMDHSLTKLVPIAGMKPNMFTQVYGDSFISGFQDGGKFTAIISIKVQDREQLESIKAEYIILYYRIDTTLTDVRPLVESYIGTHQRKFGSHGQ
ncbi:hypothetical protein ABVK25_011922 [Lepraria finkii]|uniref:Uncharacterized protein n=1 Tax=Lepraria finkii TaxID=1340010 RepID=A0ABR4AK99_9LECA